MYLTKVQHEASKLRQPGYGHCGDVYIRIYNYCIDIGDFWYNGWLYGNSFTCFYDALDKKVDTPIKAWTEDHRFAKYWRIPFNTRKLNSAFYKASAPFVLSGNVNDNIREIKNSDYYVKDSCGSYRAAAWPRIYGDLKDFVGIESDDSHPNDVICYKGGGQLYPPTGTLMGHFNPLTSTAYLARRAAEMVGMVSNDILGGGSSSSSSSSSGGGFGGGSSSGGGFGGGSSSFGGGSGMGGSGGGGGSYWDDLAPEQINKFTRITYGSSGWSKEFKEVDKLQRIYPDVTRCFRASEISEDDEELFPKDLIRPKHLGSVRHVVWNKRQACVCEMRGSVGTVELEEDDECSDIGNTDKKGFGCQLYEREEDKLDDARGNVDEDEIEGDEDSWAEMPAKCVFPFMSDGPNGCSFIDLMNGNYGPMMSGGSSGGSGGGGGFGF